MPRSALERLAERAGILPRFLDAHGKVRHTSPATQRALLEALGWAAASEADAERCLREWGRPRARRRGGRGAAAGQAAAPVTAAVEVTELLGRRRGFGIWANLYSLRGARDVGVGTLRELRALLALAGECGAAFVGISPLHATRNRPPDVSPYAGLSRVLGNPIYLDLAAVPEVAADARARALVEAQCARRPGERIDYAQVAAWQRRVLEAVLPAFRAGRGRSGGDAALPERAARATGDAGSTGGAASDSTRRRLALDFATFLAIEEDQAARGLPRDWRAWPAALRDPSSSAVAEFRAAHRDAVDLHWFAQLELERQLAECARAGERAGLALGLYVDVALGSAASGFDAWAFGEQHVLGVRLGAPPDDYSATGQDWGIPALDPRRIAGEGGLFRPVLRAACAHAGLVRLDHAMGLERQYWIPAGMPASAGAYVRFPRRDLLAIVAEESRRARCAVVGEDLGTVPRGFASRLARAGVLSSRVMLFERTAAGGFAAAARYSPRALVTANTHDHPSLAAWWRGEDLRLRAQLGLAGGAAEQAARTAARARDRELLRRRLVAAGLLRAAPGGGAEVSGGEPPDAELPYAELCRAVYAFLGSTPSPLVGVSLDDLAGEVEPVNLPGVGPEVYPSWTRRMARTVEELAADSSVRAVLGAVAAARARGGD